MLAFLNKPLMMCSGLWLCPSAAVWPSPAPAALVRAGVAAVGRVGSLGGWQGRGVPWGSCAGRRAACSPSERLAAPQPAGLRVRWFWVGACVEGGVGVEEAASPPGVSLSAKPLKQLCRWREGGGRGRDGAALPELLAAPLPLGLSLQPLRGAGG